MLLHELVIFVRQSRRKQNRRFWWKTRFFFSSHKRPLTYRWRSPTDTIFGVKQPEHRAARPLVFLPTNQVCGLFTLGSLNKRGFRYRVVEVTFFRWSGIWGGALLRRSIHASSPSSTWANIGSSSSEIIWISWPTMWEYAIRFERFIDLPLAAHYQIHFLLNRKNSQGMKNAYYCFHTNCIVGCDWLTD